MDSFKDLMLNLGIEILGILVTLFIVNKMLDKRHIKSRKKFLDQHFNELMRQYYFIWNESLYALSFFRDLDDFTNIIKYVGLDESILNTDNSWLKLINYPLSNEDYRGVVHTIDVIKDRISHVNKIVTEWGDIMDKILIKSVKDINKHTSLIDNVLPKKTLKLNEIDPTISSHIISYLSKIIKTIDETLEHYNKTINDYDINPILESI